MSGFVKWFRLLLEGGVYSKFILVMPPRLLLGLKSQQITQDFSTIALNNNRINIKLLSANKVRNKIWSPMLDNHTAG